MTESAGQGTLLQLEGGHKTVIHRPINDVVTDLTRARQEDIEFVYLESPSHGLNGYVLDPSKVVAMASVASRI
jgi:hypothetical protein